MNNRSAAREIVILALPQLPKDNNKITNLDLNNIILALSRSLSDYAKKNISSVSADLLKIENYLLMAEIEHPDNEKHTSQIGSVLIPETKVLKEKVSDLKAACTELYNAVELPELICHATQNQTLDYVTLLLKSYVENKETVNKTIGEAAQKRDKEKKWKLERMVRLDRDILRVAATELLYLKDTPTEVICDEAVKLADKYGGDESKNFINGVLRDIVGLARKQ